MKRSRLKPVRMWATVTNEGKLACLYEDYRPGALPPPAYRVARVEIREVTRRTRK